jgi:dihydroorotate dehydrogenase electron transfer subunit
MHTGKGQIVELILENGLRHARVSCHANLIPSPGQYLLSGTASSSDLLPASLYSTESTHQGFIASAPIPELWKPGQEIYLRGPFGRGFALPPSARKIVLVAFDDSPSRLHGLIQPALKQGAAVVLVCDTEEDDLPDDVEVQPISALDDILAWADYAAFDVTRDGLPGLRERLGGTNQLSVKQEAQVLVRTPVPCGGIADCGVCAVMTKSNWKLACKDGPVFDLKEL